MTPERRVGGEVRVAGRTMTGAAMVYGTVSPDFAERFEPGAFGEVRARMAINLQHDRGVVLVPSATLTDRPEALRVSATLPDRSPPSRSSEGGRSTGTRLNSSRGAFGMRAGCGWSSGRSLPGSHSWTGPPIPRRVRRSGRDQGARFGLGYRCASPSNVRVAGVLDGRSSGTRSARPSKMRTGRRSRSSRPAGPTRPRSHLPAAGRCECGLSTMVTARLRATFQSPIQGGPRSPTTKRPA